MNSGLSKAQKTEQISREWSTLKASKTPFKAPMRANPFLDFRTARYRELKLAALAKKAAKEPFQSHKEITAQVMEEWYAKHPKTASPINEWPAFVQKRVADFKASDQHMTLGEVTRIAKEEWRKLKAQEVA